MSYQVLARKWRPRDFTTLVGQEHVVRALTHALEQQRLHHAYLFTGTRGVGKTTLSRILAKALNCIGPDGNGGITAQPCGQCKACQEIDSGRFVDYIEMDAASNRGVDEMAQLLDKAVYAPTSGRFKVYMIDEVHMLTNHAFNAMLKTLEEPPGHVKFILATTDPQKIPVTVLSRCLQFNLKQMPPGHIVSHLDHILAQEGIAHDGNALRLLAQAAHGSMRDALSLTDQAIAYSAGQVSEDAVRGMLGAIDQGYLVQLLDALAAEDGAAMLAIADAMADRSLSFAGALQDLGSLLHKVALAQAVPASVQDEWPEADEVRRLAGVFDAQEVQLFYQIANLGRSELALAPDEYAGFTMTLLRMLAFRPSSEPATTQGQGGGAAPARQRGAAVLETAPPVDTRYAAAGANAAAQANAGTAAAPVPAPVPARAVLPAPMAEAAAAPAAVAASPEAAPARPAAAAGNGAMSPAAAALAAARQGSAARGGGRKAPPPAMPPAPAAAQRPPAQPLRAPGAAAVSRPPAPVAKAPMQPPVQSPAAPARPAAQPAARQAEPESVPPWELAGGSDVPPWEELPPDLPVIGPYDSDPGYRDSGFNEPAPPAAAPRNGPARPGRAPAREAEPAREAAPVPSATAPAESAKFVAPRPPAAGEDGTPPAFTGEWPVLAAGLPLKGLAQQLAYQSELTQVVGRTFHLRIPVAALGENGVSERLQQALCDHFGVPVRVVCEVGGVSITAAAADAEARAERQRQAEAVIEADPFVQGLLRDFGGQIVPGSIQPRAA
ncbi:DNA polymerase III subunit tau [Cupriavidus necator N-1]|uniref:DNA polymerase III subunit gamma/tau n=1 Tax=Cupriavidus necator (strain ATCC 43291 / DSM 13513 / CCUG 52238 / LMG 8453 / N-1) TaxID=1042878 RepID=G0F0K4_CUPNN|nr:DNA polymerase III subunit gamma/tau [Cupriavidus necator]AEI77633.1 DNA polymerase III subunit tau [Cupriavidus necator N-1]KAI3598321.1 DNA polymerase III subunit gamma and tau [Cupriavidus necator H850]MDX6013832.1 DNA polymerase III subunit gamma/tau [Cupriavidus necator]